VRLGEVREKEGENGIEEGRRSGGVMRGWWERWREKKELVGV